MVLPNRRLPAGAELLLGAAVLVAGVWAVPLGLQALASAPLISGGYALGPEGADHPLAALVIRAFACIPLGNIASRANLASVVLASVAAVWLGRMVHEVLAELSASPGQAARDRVPHALAAVGATLAVLFGLTLFQSTTSATESAVGLLVLTAFQLRALRLLRAPNRSRDGLTASLVAGLAAGAGPVVVLVCWPTALTLWVRALRQRERWARFAPLLAVAGTAVAAFGAVVTPTRGGLLPPAPLAGGPALEPALLAIGAEVGRALGAIGALVAVVGAAVLASRKRLSAALLAFAGASALILAAGRWWGPGATATAWVAALATAAVPLSAGIDHLAARLHRARTAAALVIAVIALVWPVADGGARRWMRAARLPERLLLQAHAGIGPGHQVDPGGAPMDGLLRYGRSLGLRPDLALPAAGPRR
jgi:hypothetical protein